MTTKLDQSALFIVATPIGNLQDISLRAVEVLKQCENIAAEDTRVAYQLIEDLRLTNKHIFSYHNHNESEVSQEILKTLKSQKSVVLVSDAGTPNVSDPGFRIIKLCYENQIPVIPIPGASSLTAALSICPIGGITHYFGGFLPHQGEQRIEEMKRVASLAHKIVFFESPHRILEHLKDAQQIFQEVALFRELTKIYEETFWGPVEKAIEHFEKRKPKGEFVVIFAQAQPIFWPQSKIIQEARKLLSEGLSTKNVSDRLKSHTQMSKKELYQLIVNLHKDSE